MAQDQFSQGRAPTPPMGRGKAPHAVDDHLLAVGRLAADFAPGSAQPWPHRFEHQP